MPYRRDMTVSDVHISAGGTVRYAQNGRVVIWYPTNEWTPAQVMVELKKAAAAA